MPINFMECYDYPKDPKHFWAILNLVFPNLRNWYFPENSGYVTILSLLTQPQARNKKTIEPILRKVHYSRMDGRTDGWTDGP